MTNVHDATTLDPASFSRNSEIDPLALEGIEYVEIYTDNARLSAYFFMNALGFRPIAYRGPETKYPDAASYVLQQNKITIVLTAPLKMTSPIASQILVHGMTVRDIALRVPDVQSFYYEAMKRGAKSAEIPSSWSDDKGSVQRAAIHTYGNVIHSLIDRKNYQGDFWPGFVPYEEIFSYAPPAKDCGLIIIDHAVGNVELGKMEYWVSFYEKVLGFSQMKHFTDDDIATEYSALMSKVMHNGDGKVKFPINEPAQGKRKSQIEEYLDFHNGPGVQHLALGCKDIIETVTALKERGMQFLAVPQTYYDELPQRIGSIKEDLNKIAALGVLVDRDEDGYLLQLFTKPIHDRPTLFLEIIQREGSKGFGVGNFKALFEAIEREQARRGNL